MGIGKNQYRQTYGKHTISEVGHIVDPLKTSPFAVNVLKRLTNSKLEFKDLTKKYAVKRPHPNNRCIKVFLPIAFNHYYVVT